MKFHLVIAILLVPALSTDLGRLIGADRGQCPPCICDPALVQSRGQGMGAGPGEFPSGGFPQGGTGGSGRSGVWSGGGGTVWG